MSLRTARKRAGLSQPGLAQKSGVSIWTIRNYEQGKRSVDRAPVHIILALANACECSVNDILEV